MVARVCACVCAWSGVGWGGVGRGWLAAHLQDVRVGTRVSHAGQGEVEQAAGSKEGRAVPLKPARRQRWDEHARHQHHQHRQAGASSTQRRVRHAAEVVLCQNGHRLNHAAQQAGDDLKRQEARQGDRTPC